MLGCDLDLMRGAALRNASEAQASCSPPTTLAWGHPSLCTHTHSQANIR